jgi:anaerobic glycerol-3-phosphate dehydrogenase
MSQSPCRSNLQHGQKCLCCKGETTLAVASGSLAILGSPSGKAIKRQNPSAGVALCVIILFHVKQFVQMSQNTERNRFAIKLFHVEQLLRVAAHY